MLLPHTPRCFLPVEMFLPFILAIATIPLGLSQTIKDIVNIFVASLLEPADLQQWQTTWNQTDLFSLKHTHIPFTHPGTIGDANIVLDPNTVYQQMDGFGAALSEAFQPL